MSIIIDLIMIALLIGVIMHSIHLSQSLKNFQILHGEIKPMLKEHTQSLSNSSRYAEQLRALIRDVHQTLESKTPEARMLKQDLEFMTNRANQIADHLERLLQEARVMGISTQYLSRTNALATETQAQPTLSPKKVKNASSVAAEPEKVVLPTTKETVVKQLRQKISQPKMTKSSPVKKSSTVEKSKKSEESLSQAELAKKLIEKVRGKNYAA